MIIYIINSIFPEQSGMSLRAKRELDVIAEIDNVILVCRKGKSQQKEDIYLTSNGRNVKIIRFNLKQYISKPKHYMPFLSEAIQFLKTSIIMGCTLFKLLSKTKSDIYVTASPTTIVLISIIISKITHNKLKYLEFHDLEPELAIDNKNLNQSSLLIKIHLTIEKYIIKKFDKIIVTTEAQRKVLLKRNIISIDRISAIYNSVDSSDYNITENKAKHFREKYNIKPESFVLTYIGSISNFNYIYSGLKKIIDLSDELQRELPNFLFLIVGKGDALDKLKKYCSKNNIENVLFLGYIDSISDALSGSNSFIIPWEKTNMTQTMYPTKGFEYMISKKPILVPNYGEFKKLFKDRTNALFFNPENGQELKTKIVELSNNPEFCKKIAHNAYKDYMLNYDWNIMKKKYKSVFLENKVGVLLK